jgi:hypothetical protein
VFEFVQVSIVSTLPSLQSASVLHVGVQLLQKAVQVPAFSHSSTGVRALWSSQSEFFAQTGVQDLFSHVAEHVFGLLHVSVVSGLPSLQSASVLHIGVHAVCSHVALHVFGFRHLFIDVVSYPDAQSESDLHPMLQCEQYDSHVPGSLQASEVIVFPSSQFASELQIEVHGILIQDELHDPGLMQTS